MPRWQNHCCRCCQRNKRKRLWSSLYFVSKKAVLDILEQMFNLGPLYTDYDGLFYIIHIDAYTIQTLPVEIYDCLVEAGMKMPYVS